ncbi:Reverse transcriptase RNA-dependent DNA polymerase [Arabidopsis suecica]|uniref:Reverse transcriptase RNA-dependent DNA polymerase n=1 Tax=Arabidopsis suecica TaxID=45249 RepID=A0A8T2CJY6_ARASU|nr:Reverse transcriptase RNA-dependent DNA polymerase [Arabidopsis suecica]
MSMSLKAQAHVLEDSPYDARLALNENPKNPNPKNRGYYSSATLFIGDTVHRRHCSSAILFIAVTIHRRYCSSRLLFIAVTIHRRYCSSRLLFIAATVHRDYCSSPLLFIAATIHRRYCSSPLLFIAATVHRGYYSSPLLFIAATVHRGYCSSRLLFIAATVHRGYCSSPLLFIAATIHRRYCSSPLLFIAATVRRGYCSSRLLFIAATVHHDTVHRRYCSSQLLFITVLFIVDTVHRGTVCGSLQQRELLRSLAPSSLPYNPIRPQRIRKNPKNLTTSKVIDHTAVTVVDGKDVVVATITHPAVGTTITVDVDPIPAVVEGEDDVVFPNHNTRPNEYVIDVVLKGRGCGHYNSSGRGNHYNRGCRPNSGRGRGRGRCEVHWIIYMRLPEGIELKDKDKKVSRDQYCIRLNKSLYGLKQSGRMWYNRLSDYLVREGYKNDPISPCIFIKKFANEGFVIIAVYVDDLNILGTSGEIAQTVEYLKKEFEMKDLGKTKFCLGLQLEYVNNGILVHQKAYTEKVLKRFNMDQAHPLSSPMVVRSLGLDSDSFGPKKDEEEVLGPEVPYLSAIGALMYLASHTRPDICFAVNLLCLNLVHDQPKGTGKAVFFKAQLLQHQRPSYLKTTQPVIAQLKDSYIKGDRTKHILPKFFFTHDLQRDGEVRVVQVRSSDNSADLFTKALPTSTLRKLTHQIGMRRLKDLQG